VAVNGDYVYIADDTAGLLVISVSDPTHPIEIGYSSTPDPAYGIAANGDYAYVADDNLGLYIYQFYGSGIEEGRQPTVKSVPPSATIIRGTLELGSRLTASGSDLFDAHGRKVMDIPHSAFRTPHPVDVSALAPGIYFVRSADSGQRTAMQKIVIAR
jgi:hypothetical protein